MQNQPEPSHEQILMWKNEYFEIFHAEIQGESFIYRPLSYLEYRYIIDQFEENQEREELVCQLAVLYPERDEQYWEEEAGGPIPFILAKEILDNSYLTTEREADVKRYRIQEELKVMESFQEQVACLIKEAFPNLTLEEIMGWGMRKVIWYEARARYVLTNLRGIQFMTKDQETAHELELQMERERAAYEESQE